MKCQIDGGKRFKNYFKTNLLTSNKQLKVEKVFGKNIFLIILAD